MAKKKSTTTKAKDSKGSGVTVKKVRPEKEVKKALPKTSKRARVKFVSNGNNPRLGESGTIKEVAPETADQFAANGWGTVKK